MKADYEYIMARIKAVIDQFYAFRKYNAAYVEKVQTDYIGGVLQAALFLLPNDRYYEVKYYIFDTYGYDPGGCADRQMSIFEIMGSE